MLTDLWCDVCRSARALRREPRFSLPSILLLALGTAAVTTLFGVVYALLLKPLPFPQADRLVEVGAPVYNVYDRGFQNRRSLAPIFSHIAAYWQTTARQL